MKRICPNPIPWNALHEQLLKVAERRPDLRKPPTPLILNGWVFSSDAEKEARWAETVRWADIAGCRSVIDSVLEHEFYEGTRAG